MSKKDRHTLIDHLQFILENYVHFISSCLGCLFFLVVSLVLCIFCILVLCHLCVEQRFINIMFFLYFILHTNHNFPSLFSLLLTPINSSISIQMR